MRRKTYEDLFFSFMKLCSKLDNTVDSIAAVFFNSCSYYNSYIWPKDIALTFKKSYTL